MVIDPCAKYGMPVSNQKLVMGQTRKHMSKTPIIDLVVKGQCRFGIINVRDTSSHSDTPMYQVWYANVKPRKS